MTKDSESMPGKCGCGSDSTAEKACPGSESEKKSGFSKTPCKAPSGKGKCHESHEEFKKKPAGSDKQCNSAGDNTRDKCVSSYEEFSRAVSAGGSPCGGGSQTECHDSYKKFQEIKVEDCSSSHNLDSEQEGYCKESQLKSVPCAAQQKRDPCSGSFDKMSDNAALGTKPKCQSNIQKSPCSNSIDSIAKKKEPPCVSKREEPSLYSQITSRCKDMAKEFVKPKSKTKCNSIDDTSQVSICNKTKLSPSLPCPPKTEKRVGYGPPCCTSKVTCPESKTSSWADFFPLDARNQKLNSCIEKYSRIDPGQVISQCSQYANKTVDTSERCVQQGRRVQQQCQQHVRSSEAPKSAASTLMSARSRVVISRWAPSAALYMATSALITLYLTEWKAVPIYTDDTDKESKPS